MKQIRRCVQTALAVALKSFGVAATVCVDSICLVIPAAKRDVAIVVRLDAIGDFFIWLQSGAVDVVNYARSAGYRTVLIANSIWADYARELGLWDEVVGIDPGRFTWNLRYRVSCLCRIRRIGARLLIQPRSARVFLQEDEVARISGAPQRIGSAGTLLNTNKILSKFGARFYHQLIEVSQCRDVHETIRNNDFIVGLTGKVCSRLVLPVMSRFAGRKVVAVALGAGWSGRVWPVERLGRLIEYIARSQPSLKIVLLGMASDRPTARELMQAVDCELENYVGETGLGQFIEFVAESWLTICNDSSAYHIAMAFDRNVLCFLGGGHFSWFAPYPASRGRTASAQVLYVKMPCYWCNWNCKYPRTSSGAFRCVDAISLEEAIRAVQPLLDTAPE
jgi:hypothetical protein